MCSFIVKFWSIITPRSLTEWIGLMITPSNLSWQSGGIFFPGVLNKKIGFLLWLAYSQTFISTVELNLIICHRQFSSYRQRISISSWECDIIYKLNGISFGASGKFMSEDVEEQRTQATTLGYTFVNRFPCSCFWPAKYALLSDTKVADKLIQGLWITAYQRQLGQEDVVRNTVESFGEVK